MVELGVGTGDEAEGWGSVNVCGRRWVGGGAGCWHRG